MPKTSVIYDDQGKIRLKSPRGTSTAIRPEDLGFYISQGFTTETPYEAAIRESVEDSDNFIGKLNVAGEEFVNQLAFGLPEIIKRKTDDPLQVAIDDAIKKEHSASRWIGGVPGFVGSLAVGGPLWKGAAKGGQIAQKAVQKAITNRMRQQGVKQVGAKAFAKKAAAKTIDKAAQYGAEGLVTQAPYAITEAALAEDNENPFELAGESLAAGGLLSAALGVGSVAAKPFARFIKNTTKAVTKPLIDVVKQQTDPRQVIMDVVGLTPSKKQKFVERFSKKYVNGKRQRVDANERLLRFMKDKVGYDRDVIMSESLKDRLDDYIENTLIKRGDDLVDKIAIKAPREKVFQTLNDRLESLIAQAEQRGGALSQKYTDKVRNIQDQVFDTIASMPEQVPARRLWDLKKWVGKSKSNLFKDATYNQAEKEALESVYFGIDEVLTNLFPGGGPNPWRELMDDWSMALFIQPSVTNKVGKDAARQVASLGNVARVGVGATFGGPLGATMGAVASPLFADYRRYGIIYAEEAMKKVAKGLENIPIAIKSQVEKAKVPAIKKVTEQPRQKAIYGAVRLLGDTQEERVKEYKRIQKRAIEFNSDPMYAANKLGEVTGILTNTGAPQIANEFARKNAVMAKYFSDTAPKPKTPDKPYYKQKYTPNDMELSEFERRLEVVQNPFSAIEDFEEGTLTETSVDALRNIYPRIYARIQQKVIETLMDTEEDIPYETRLQLALLLGEPTDPSLEDISVFQQAYTPESTQGDSNRKAPGLDVPNIQTDIQRISED